MHTLYLPHGPTQKGADSRLPQRTPNPRFGQRVTSLGATEDEGKKNKQQPFRLVIVKTQPMVMVMGMVMVMVMIMEWLPSGFVRYLSAKALLSLNPLVERRILRVRREIPLEHQPHRVALEPQQRLHPDEHIAELEACHHHVSIAAGAHASVPVRSVPATR